MKKPPPNPSSLPPDILQRIIEDRKVRRNTARESHLMFFSIYLGTYVEFASAPFHREFFALTEDEDTRMTVLVAFRGSGKSTIMTLSYPIWSIIGKLEKKFVLLLSETQNQARQYIVNIREELERNELLRADLGPFKQQEDEWGNATLVIPKYGARIMAASTEQSVRGIRHGAHRPDLIIADDVEDTNSAKTREGRDKVYNWLTSEILPAGNTRTKVLVIGNLLHEDCLPMRLRRDIELRKRRGIYKEYPLVSDDDQIAWPGQFPNMKAIRDYRLTIGNEVAWQREYMLKMVPDENQLIHHDWIKYYDRRPGQDDPKFRYVAIGVDLALSKNPWADYTAMVAAEVYGHGDEFRIYILPHPVNEKLTYLEAMDKAMRLSRSSRRDDGKAQLYVEVGGYQGSAVEYLESKLYPVEGVKTQGLSKEARLSMVSHLVQSGKVVFPRTGAETLIGQLTGFGTERHDDLADAFVILLKQVMKDDRAVGTFSVSLGPSYEESLFPPGWDDPAPPSPWDDNGGSPFTAGLMDKQF